MLKEFRISLLLVLLAVTGLIISASVPKDKDVRPMSAAEQTWVDSVFATLTPDQRLGQLFMVAAYSNKDKKHVARIDELVKTYGIGGLMFLQGGPAGRPS
ncbi:hypothetical protein [Hymenobacter cellulosilyticus]|uniref:Glycoside hydrolase family 3 N-terminal domain-containing protein n=1 Tax=Hymenobacter cellulosilyticus TaxID=2932248 RepID=A0A8T9QA65_9BACT|nr:hypothetical protein [Hymenobacter cellulosilyticus]UOQ74466.1 hypothetical protein MUN79_11640 [Hymenobacter cellulosilyticus]